LKAVFTHLISEIYRRTLSQYLPILFQDRTKATNNANFPDLRQDRFLNKNQKNLFLNKKIIEQLKKICNTSVEFLKQVEISGKQPYFLPNFSEQNHSPKNLSSNESPPILTLLPYSFF
jgi:hypothetical protein